MRLMQTNDAIPLQLGPKVPSTEVTGEQEQASAQAFGRQLFESVDLGRLVGITEVDCRQKRPAVQLAAFSLSDDQLAELVEMRGGCNCHIRPPCFACSEPITQEEAEFLELLATI